MQLDAAIPEIKHADFQLLCRFIFSPTNALSGLIQFKIFLCQETNMDAVSFPSSQ